MLATLHTEAVDVQIGDCMEDMIRNLSQERFQHAHAPYYENYK